MTVSLLIYIQIRDVNITSVPPLDAISRLIGLQVTMLND
jgi:hypothetical protein